MGNSTLKSIEDITSADARKFFSKLPIELDPENCWIWQGYGNKDGRGRVWIQNKQWLAPHISWMLAYGVMVPHGVQVQHECDEPACVNPFHLTLGAPLKNHIDAITRGRKASKLTVDLVRVLRQSSLPDATWAKICECHPRTIKLARQGRTWRFL